MPVTSTIQSPHQKLLDFLTRISDISLIGLGLWLTHVVCDENWRLMSTVLLLCSIIYYQLSSSLAGIYSFQRSIEVRQQIYTMLLALGSTFILVGTTANLSNRMHGFADRSFLLIWSLWSILLLSVWRIAVRKVLASLRRQGINNRSALIVGAGTLGKNLAERFQHNLWMGIDVHGFYDDTTEDHVVNNLPVLGNIEQLIIDVKNSHFDHIYITLPMSAQERITSLIDELSDCASNVFLIPDVFVFDLMNSRQTTIDGLPAISIYDTPFTFTDGIIKRGFDIVGSLGILCLILIPMFFIAIAVKISSKGPIFFKQIRYGLDGKAIEVWKFRSMTTMDNGSVVKQATKNDKRITPLGSFLRRTSLDELPQFINVLQGQMSIVGPRPHAVAHNEEYRKLIKGYMLRHKVKPGITGWAQINGWRGETDTLEKMEKRVEYDLAYIRNWTVWLDVKIVFLTAFKGFVNKNAY